MRKGYSVLTLAMGIALPAACSSNPGIGGECTGSIRFHNLIYVADSRANQAARQGRVIGPGAFVDCDHRTVVASVRVSELEGVHTRVAIGVGRGTWRGVYVAEDVRPDRWPSILQRV